MWKWRKSVLKTFFILHKKISLHLYCVYANPSALYEAKKIYIDLYKRPTAWPFFDFLFFRLFSAFWIHPKIAEICKRKSFLEVVCKKDISNALFATLKGGGSRICNLLTLTDKKESKAPGRKKMMRVASRGGGAHACFLSLGRSNATGRATKASLIVSEVPVAWMLGLNF